MCFHAVKSIMWSAMVVSVLSACGGGGTSSTSATVPGAPTVGTGTPGNGSASIAFTAPSDNGGAAISGYTATCVNGTSSVTGTATASPVNVTGLTNGSTYSCSVTATNSAGTGAASSAVSVTPSGGSASVTVPSAPVVGTATPGNGSASIAFTAPSDNGGAAISGYTATCVSAASSVAGTATASPVTVSGLTNGSTYSCSVKATNSAGTGAASLAVSVTPSAGSLAISTAGILCSVTDSGTQLLSYTNSAPGSTAVSVNESLPYSYSWSCSGTSRTMTGNGVPNHAVTGGNFATKVSSQSLSASVTTSPTAGSSSTAVKLPGYALNSVKMDPATAGTCTNSATSDTSGCNYAGGNGTWRMEALNDPGVSPWRFDFGTDVNNAHVQPNGQYHYHGMPTLLMSKLNSASANSMTLVGWAADGFPMYANLGYSTATNASSALKEMKGSYRTKTTPDSGRPSTSLFAMGHFQQDWEYVAGLGDLDECNGRTGVTPEFPNGIYHYYITKTYPFIQRCVKGSPASWANSLP